MTKINITKEFLIKEYIKNKKSITIIAKGLNCSITTIFYRLKEYEIKTRRIESKYCIDCGIEINKYDKNTKRCHSCATKLQYKENPTFNKGKNNYFFGKHFTKEKNARWKGSLAVERKVYYCIELNCDNKICYGNFISGHKRCNSCSKQGVLNSMFGKSGRLSPTFGKTMAIPNKVIYRGIKMRSSWELLYAKYLDKQNTKWKYESKTFDLGNCTYTPDFYLPETDTYIEIKGYLTVYAKRKINRFKKLYSNIEFEFLKQKELQKLGVLK